VFHVYPDVACPSCGQPHTFCDAGYHQARPVGSRFVFTCPTNERLAIFRSAAVPVAVAASPPAAVEILWIPEKTTK
jgi:hypothetical protein